jgi:hypothetical protein
MFDESVGQDQTDVGVNEPQYLEDPVQGNDDDDGGNHAGNEQEEADRAALARIWASAGCPYILSHRSGPFTRTQNG